jgi:HK97 family phage prohead protease
MKVKALEFKALDFDEGSRKVSGLLSAFNIKDSDGDVIRPNSFMKSINDRGPKSGTNRRIAHLRNHDWEHQIGKFLELEETQEGLKFVSQLGRSTKGTDAFLDYQDGILNEHSIGFEYVDGKRTAQKGEDFGEFYEITEVKLWEGSAVTFGANQYTPVYQVAKSENEAEALSYVEAKMDAFTNALKRGDGTDERLYAIEMGIKQCKELYREIFKKFNTQQQPEPTTVSRKDDSFIYQLM